MARSQTHDPAIVSVGVRAFNRVSTFLEKSWQDFNFFFLILQSLERPKNENFG